MKKRIHDLLACIKQGTFERDEVIALSLLAALSGESIFLLGLPGVGKSMVARRLKLAFKDASVFEYLMSRFSTPDEIFGPVSISRLKDNDSYERVTAGFLPDADIVFLDEIWKAGPAIQNSLLTVLNEKVFLNGNVEMRLPLKGVIAASNELPAEGEGLEALWDRFLLRYIVEPIEQKRNFFNLLMPTEVAKPSVGFQPISLSEYVSFIQKSRQVRIPDDALDIIFQIRSCLNDRMTEKDPASGEPIPENMKFYISDRRWKKAVGIMQMSAFLNGRTEIDPSDLMLLAHILWNDEAAIPVVRYTICETIVVALYRRMLDRHKCSRRHAVSDPEAGSKLYSPDNFHYIIQCDDAPLKIKIADYELLKKAPNKLFFASETTDGSLMLRADGIFAIRFADEGVLCINNFNYKLIPHSENQLDKDFIYSISDYVDTVVNSLIRMMNSNLFVANSNMQESLQQVVIAYRNRKYEPR